MSRTVLRGGTVIDGMREVCRRADVAFAGGRISEVGVIEHESGDTVFDVSGKYVMPGFIDAHAHTDGTLFDEDVQSALLRQGVTTVIAGQDGVSYAPGDGRWASAYFAAINGPHPTYRGGGVRELLRTYDGTTPINVGYLVPAGTVRQEVMGMVDRSPTGGELSAMQDLVEAGMEEGALGLSTGLDYVPGIFASPAEIAALCEPVAAVDGVYVTHMRGGYEDNSEVGVQEVVDICRRSGVMGHISHFHLQADEAYRLLSQAEAAGVELTFDMYPYTRGCTLLGMPLLPPEYSAMPVNQVLAALGDVEERLRLVEEWFPQVSHKPSLGPDWPQMVTIAHMPAEEWKWVEGLTLAAIAEHEGISPEETVMELLMVGRMEVSAVMAVRNERPVEDLGRLFSHSGHVAGSDGIFVGGSLHPRAYGTFAKYLSTYVGEHLSWGQAGIHLSGRAASRFGLSGRGVVHVGAVADLCVVDPEEIRDEATYQEPLRSAEGISEVFVRGEAVLTEGRLTGRCPGQGLRRSGSVR